MFAYNIRAALVAALLVSGPVAGARAQSASVSFHRYELATPVGQTAVLDRIRKAATRACNGSSLVEFMNRKSCTATLTEQMVSGVGSPVLTALLDGPKPVELAANAR